MLNDVNNFQKSHQLLNYFEINAVGFVSIKKFTLCHGPVVHFSLSSSIRNYFA